MYTVNTLKLTWNIYFYLFIYLPFVKTGVPLVTIHNYRVSGLVSELYCSISSLSQACYCILKCVKTFWMRVGLDNCFFFLILILFSKHLRSVESVSVFEMSSLLRLPSPIAQQLEAS